MRLKDWLDSIGKSTFWLADECGVTEQSVRRWIDGTQTPLLSHLIRIEELSKGRVRPKDVLESPSPKRRPGRPPRSSQAPRADA